MIATFFHMEDDVDDVLIDAKVYEGTVEYEYPTRKVVVMTKSRESFLHCTA